MAFTIPGTNITFGRPVAPVSTYKTVVYPKRGASLSVTDDPFSAGGGFSGGNTPIDVLVRRLSKGNISLETELHLRHTLRENLSDLQTALLMRRALEGDLIINSKDEGLQEELRAFAKWIPIGYVTNKDLTTGLDLYLDIMADTADEYGPAVGEIGYEGRRPSRLLTPDMRTFRLKNNPGQEFGSKLIQIQDGREVPIQGPAIQILAFKGSSSTRWPPSLMCGAELPGEALLRMITSLNSLWLKAGDPPIMYSIEYDKEAPVATSTETDPDGNTVIVDPNLQALASAVQEVKDARRRGMMAEIVISIVGGTVKAEPVFGDVTTASLSKDPEPHFRIASGLLAQLTEVPSWVFASGNNKAEGMGSNRSNNEAALAIGAAERRRRRIMPLARQIINAFILGERSTRSINNFTFEWTAPNIINEKLVEETRASRATADSTFVRTSFELYNPEGIGINDEQRAYLERNGVLEAEEVE